MSKKRKIKELTAQSIKGIKPSGKRQSFYDGNYLYLFVSPKGKKAFYFKGYYFNGRRINEFALGEFFDGKAGDLKLAEARDLARDIVRCYRNGIDYREQERIKKAQKAAEQTNTFKHWSNRWLKSKQSVSAKTMQGYHNRLDNYILPYIGNLSITEITTYDILQLLKAVEATGKLDTTQRCKTICNQVYNFANANMAVNYNPVLAISGDALKKPIVQHMPAITDPKKIGKLLCDIDNYHQCNFLTKTALQIACYVMLRPKEIRFAKWEYIDFDNRLWRIPAKIMKKNRDHIIPLANQVIILLERLNAVTGDGVYLFPNSKRNAKHPVMSENTMNNVLKKLGYQGVMVSHGFRGMTSTNLNELEYNRDHVEKQLAHEERNKSRKAYNRAEYLSQRAKMLQEWADYIDQLKEQHTTKLIP